MKIGLSEAAARKTLAMIPTKTADPDLLQVRERLEQGLKVATAGGHLQAEDLDALIWAAEDVIETVRTNPNPSLRVQAHALRLKQFTIPKLEALKARKESGW